MRLVNCSVGVGSRSRVGIRNGDSPERLARDLAWTLALGPFRIEEIVIFVCVAMRPAIDGDCVNIVRWVKTARTQHSAKLVANVALKCLEGSRQQIAAPSAMLIALWKSRQARRALHANHYRLVG